MKQLIISAILLISWPSCTLTKNVVSNPNLIRESDNNIDNSIIDFDEEYLVKYGQKNGISPLSSRLNNIHRYTIVNNFDKNLDDRLNNDRNQAKAKLEQTSTLEYDIMPIELTSTTENNLEITLDPELAVIPLSTTKRPITIEIKQTVTLPSSTQETDTTTDMYREFTTTTEYTTTKKRTTNNKTTKSNTTKNTTTQKTTTENKTTKHTTTENTSIENTTSENKITKNTNTENTTTKHTTTEKTTIENITTQKPTIGNTITPSTTIVKNTTKQNETIETSYLTTAKETATTGMPSNTTVPLYKDTNVTTEMPHNISKENNRLAGIVEYDVPIFTELDMQEELDVPEDYYDTKDIIPTSAPKTDALSVLVGIAGSVVGSVVENVAEKVVPKGIVDLFRRVRHQNEMLEAERLRSREENGGIGQFGRGILKSISSGITKPLSQFMAGVRDAGSLDHDQGFVSGVATGIASGVTSVANVASSVVEQFKDRVQAIYPGTVWCGDGRSATARSSDLGLFFFTDTCCRQHDACKMYIKAGDTKYGLTNTGLFTRSHCSCDTQFRECLRKTNSLVSTQIGLTYFNVLGPQCFRKAHPIVKCVKRTRITGQKCEEYELDITKPKMWQWFDNLTF